MTLAEEIRKSFALPNDFFTKYAVPSLRKSGRFSVICDTHIAKIENWAIPFRYGNSLEEWAEDNGFRVGHHLNISGVRYIDITI